MLISRNKLYRGRYYENLKDVGFNNSISHGSKYFASCAICSAADCAAYAAKSVDTA
jgi:hypothetical protein